MKKVAAVALAAGEAWRSLLADKRQEYDQMSLQSKVGVYRHTCKLLKLWRRFHSATAVAGNGH